VFARSTHAAGSPRPGLDLGEALELTSLVVLRDRERGRRYAVRSLQRWLETTTATIEDSTLVASCPVALGATATPRRWTRYGPWP